ncbi:tripartite tricarboxylate transporter substrate binding protein [Vibrio sp. HA2012]|uniref:tripartite tricarboxylate transporter substrate binding protein n=1 Tax=Vibrio sp. HA2012 TaxID=1971595 RepID=UPI000C2BE03B|nr:tripartite tricarboxylate transporter substrate binding protein [Vibrio sp. HA2012]PJC86843.1 tripartite tricarboxylate transporter substrate binding protein [Vibrio sp. HA2012]
MKKAGIIKILTIAISCTLFSQTQAADYPSKDIRIIVPFTPGGGVDTTSRIIAEYANEELNDTKIKIENRAGGGGVVGQTYAARAEPDGYTILAMTSSVVTNPKLKPVAYKVSDFEPVALYNYDPEVIAVASDSDIDDIQEFIELAKKQDIHITEAGNATSHHLSGMAIIENAGLNLKFIHTKGFGKQLQALLGGHADAALWPYGEAKPQIDAGKIRLLAIATPERMIDQPDIPTWKESGLNVNEWATFRGWAVPKGTSPKIVTYLSDLMGKVNQNPGYIQKMKAQGFPLSYQDASGYKAVIDGYDSLTESLIKKIAKTE